MSSRVTEHLHSTNLLQEGSPVFSFNEAGHLRLGTLDILSQTILYCGDCPVPWQLFSSMSDLYSLDNSSTLRLW